MAGAVVAITGVSGQLGGAVAEILDRDPAVAKIVGIDLRPPPAERRKLEFCRRDVCQPGLAELFRGEGVDRVAHLAFLLDTVRDRERARRIDVDGSRSVLEACAGAGVVKVVFSSSSVVYGAHADNPVPIPEGHPQRPDPHLQYEVDKVEVERLCRGFARRHSDIRVAVLRPVTIVGPGMDNFISRFLERPVWLQPRGHDPYWQYVHETDCARAVAEMLFNELEGSYNLGADNWLRFSEVARIGGRRIVRSPKWLLSASAELFWRLGLRQLSEVNSTHVKYQCHPPVLDNRKLKRDAGFAFTYDSRQAIASFFAGRSKAQDAR
jgi:UDP-glucose 4-epimerase